MIASSRSRYLHLLALLFTFSCSPPAPAPAPAPPRPSARPVCGGGLGDCDGDRGNGCETSLDASERNCGACGRSCAQGERCLAARCQKKVKLAIGAEHVCAAVGGKVFCWGNNGSGQLGDGTTQHRASPVAVSGLADVEDVVVGYGFSAALSGGGALSIWGKGRAVTAPAELKPKPLLLPQNKALSWFSGDAHHIKAIGVGGSSVEVHQGPEGFSVMDLGAEKFPDDVTRVVSSTNGTTCVLQRSGQVACKGGNMGDGTDQYQVKWKPVPGLGDITQLSLGHDHACALRRSGELACWGRNEGGRLGDGTEERRLSPTPVKGVADVIEVAAGSTHTCAVLRSGKVLCWGLNRWGELGDGSFKKRLLAAPVPELDGVSHLAAGAYVTCAARAPGGISCWGSNAKSRLGVGQQAEFVSPVPLKGLSRVALMSPGPGQGCALHQGGTVSCWGGEPGPQGPDVLQPTEVAGVTDAVALQAIAPDACALRKGGTLLCFRATGADRFVVRPVVGLSGVTAIAAATRLAVLGSGRAVTWSYKGPKKLPSGQEGIEVSVSSIPGIADAAEILGDYGYLCVRRRSGEVLCGSVEIEQSKDGRPVTSSIKKANLLPALGLRDATGLSMNSNKETCALRKTGEVTCWPPFTVKPKASPGGGKPGPVGYEATSVTGVTGGAQIAATSLSTCVLSRSGKVSCWGGNFAGELGTGDFDPRKAPTPVEGVEGVTHLSARDDAVCVALRSGEALCWGGNGGKKLGRGDIAYSAKPLLVQGLPE